jgi:hypothetical protein
VTVREFPASIGQRLMWFLEHYRSGSSSVSCPALFRIRGEVDPARLERALRVLSARHDALRTTVRRHGRTLVQQVHEELPAELAHRSLPEGAEHELEEQLTAELRERIPIEESPVRYVLWSLGARDRVLCVNMHHLVSDAWTCAIVIDELIELLAAGDGRAATLPSIGWQYPRFSQWQQEQSENGELAAHVDYWNTKLRGVAVPRPPRAPGASSVDRPVGALATASLPGELGDALRAFAKAERTTLFSVMLALYYVLLHQVTGATDLAVSSLFANRTRAEVQRTVGFLANMLVLRTELDPSRSFRTLLASTRATVVEAVVHQAVPCHMLPLASLLASPGRVDDVVFQMLPDRRPGAWDPSRLAAGIEIDTLRPNAGMSRFGLNLTVIPRGDRVDTRLSYAANQFEPEWAERFLAGYGALASLVLTDASRALGTLAGSSTSMG